MKHPECPVNEVHPFFPVKWVYTPPVIGGSFVFPQELLQKHNFVFELTECKVKTAYILEHLH